MNLKCERIGLLLQLVQAFDKTKRMEQTCLNKKGAV